MSRGTILAYTDASRHGIGPEASAAYAWVAEDALVTNSLVTTRVQRMETNAHSTVHAETEAVLDVVATYGDAQELHVFTDGAFIVDQWTRECLGLRRRSTLYREEITALAQMEHVQLHSISAHKSYFLNEVADQMSRLVAAGEASPAEAEAWGRRTCRQGMLEIFIARDRVAFSPKRVWRHHPKNGALVQRALGSLS